MTIEMVRDKLKNIIYTDFRGEHIRLDKRMSVDTTTFVTLFASCTECSYSELMRVDGGTMGYATYIQGWKDSGLIE